MFVNFCLRYRKSVVIFWLVLLVAASGALGRRLLSGETIIDNSVGIWFMSDDPELKVYERYNQDFGEKEWSILLLKTASIYDPGFLRDLARITGRIEKLGHIVKVVSLTNVRDSKTAPDGSLEYTQLYPARDPGDLLTRAQTEGFRKRLLENHILENSVYHREDTQTTAILFQNDNFIHDAKPYRIELIDAIKAIVREYPAVTDSSLAGTTVVNAELNRSSKNDSIKFYVLVVLFIVGTGYLLLKNVKDLAILLTVVANSVVIPMAVIALLKIPYNMVTVMLPPVLITLSVCDIVHVINAYHFERARCRPEEAIVAAIGKIWVSCLWTSVITIVGFLSLLSSTVNPIWQLGAFASLGMFIAWFITMTLVPILLVAFWPRQAEPAGKAADGSREVGMYAKKLIPILSGNYRWLWLGLTVAMLYSLTGINKLTVDTNYVHFFASSQDITRSYSKIKDAGFGQSPISIVLRYPEGGSVAAEGYFSKLLQFESEVRKDASVIKLLSVTDLIDRIDSAFNGKDTAGNRIAGYSREKISQLLLLGELAGNDDIKDFVSEDKNLVQLIAMTPYMSSRELEVFRKKVCDIGKAVLPPDITLEMTGTPILWANMDKHISRTVLYSIYIIAAVFILLMLVIFRSLKFGLICIVINTLPLAMTFGVMGLLGININMATVLIGNVAIGSDVDSTLFFINRVRLGLAEGMSWDKAVDYAIITVGDGTIMTSLILSGGFFCLAASNFLPTAHFGALVTASIIVSLFLDIIINPIILKLAGAREDALKARG